MHFRGEVGGTPWVGCQGAHPLRGSLGSEETLPSLCLSFKPPHKPPLPPAKKVILQLPLPALPSHALPSPAHRRTLRCPRPTCGVDGMCVHLSLHHLQGKFLKASSLVGRTCTV